MWDYPKGSQKGIIAIEKAYYETVYSARYGTFDDFLYYAVFGAKVAPTATSKGLEKYRGKTLKFKVTGRDTKGNPIERGRVYEDGLTIRGLDQGANDDRHGVNHWVHAYGKNGGPDLAFFYFHKDSGTDVIPTKALSEYFYMYEPFLKKRK